MVPNSRILGIRQAIHTSLRLLSKRDQTMLRVATVAQMLLAFLDLVGVLLIGVVASLAWSVASGTQPTGAVQQAINRLGFGDKPLIYATASLAIIAAGALIAKSLLSIYLTRRTLRFLANRQARVSTELATKYFSLPLSQLQRMSSQESAFALTAGVTQATLIVLGQSTVAISESALLAILALGLLLVDPIVTIATVTYFGLVALLLHRLLSGWAGRIGRIQASADIESYESVQEALKTYRELTVSGRRANFINKFENLRWQTASVQSDMQFVTVLSKYIFEIALVVGGILLAVSQFVYKDLSSAIATMAIFLVAGSRVVPSLLRMQAALLNVRTGSGSAEPTYALAEEVGIEGPQKTRCEESKEAIGRDTVRSHVPENWVPTVSLIDFTCQYEAGGDPALSNISLEISSGESVALVGPTGAGKSTLADAMLGLILPTHGVVSLGGLDPRQAIAEWPGSVAYVPQDVFIVNGTVRDNVALALLPSETSDQRVWEAIERAHLSEFLIKCRDGIETVVGEGGVKLSGGQRQRLGIARALYSNPRLLILDEATSALDAGTENDIVQMIAELRGRVTTVTVAHRLATVRSVDKVVYLESGVLKSVGSFEEVRQAVPEFEHQARLLGL